MRELRPGGVEAMMAAQGIDDADIVQKLRYAQHYTNAKWAGAAADEIEKLRASIAAIHCHALMGTSHDGLAAECETVIPRLSELRPTAKLSERKVANEQTV